MFYSILAVLFLIKFPIYLSFILFVHKNAISTISRPSILKLMKFILTVKLNTELLQRIYREKKHLQIRLNQLNWHRIGS